MSGETIGELEAAYERSRIEVQDIQAQLSQRKPVGRVADEEFREYREWHGRAVVALRHRLAELGAARMKLRDARREVLTNTSATSPASFADLKSAHGLIRAAYATLKGLAAEVEVESEEQAVIDALQAWLGKNGVAP